MILYIVSCLKSRSLLPIERNSLRDYSKLREELEAFRRNTASEFDLADIEKWMTKELGVTRIKSKSIRGSKVVYRHRGLVAAYGTGHFRIDKRHKKKETILRRNFLNHMVKPLRIIIDFLEWEEQDGS